MTPESEKSPGPYPCRCCPSPLSLFFSSVWSRRTGSFCLPPRPAYRAPGKEDDGRNDVTAWHRRSASTSDYCITHSLREPNRLNPASLRIVEMPVRMPHDGAEARADLGHVALQNTRRRGDGSSSPCARHLGVLARACARARRAPPPITWPIPMLPSCTSPRGEKKCAVCLQSRAGSHPGMWTVG